MIKLCSSCCNNKNCYAYSPYYPERAETCIAFNNMLMEDAVNKDSVKTMGEERRLNNYEMQY